MVAAQVILVVCIAVLTIVALVHDLWAGTLPNWLTVPAFAVGLLFHMVVGCWQAGLVGLGGGLLFALGGFATGFGILFVLWLVGASAGGDVKLMGALGSWLGAWAIFQVLVLSALFAGLCSLVILGLAAMGFNPRRAWAAAAKSRSKKGKKSESAGRSLVAHRRAVPYGVPVTLATWTVLALQLSGHAMPWPG
jgi:prepilin peptidase CpaA